MFRTTGLLVSTTSRAFSTRSVALSAKLTVPPETMSATDFLNKIGRGASEHSELFPTWGSIFTVTRAEMKEKGIESNYRRYILNWRYKYRQDSTIKLYEIKTGKKINGGERKRRAFLAQHR